jgi:hypothetical protein
VFIDLFSPEESAYPKHPLECQAQPVNQARESEESLCPEPVPEGKPALALVEAEAAT